MDLQGDLEDQPTLRKEMQRIQCHDVAASADDTSGAASERNATGQNHKPAAPFNVTARAVDESDPNLYHTILWHLLALALDVGLDLLTDRKAADPLGTGRTGRARRAGHARGTRCARGARGTRGTWASGTDVRREGGDHVMFKCPDGKCE